MQHTPTSPSDIGARAEAAVASALVRAGLEVYLPAFAPHARVDLVYDDHDRLVRVQCKTARIVRGGLMFRVCSNTSNRPRCYEGEVDEFGVYAPSTGVVYLVPNTALPTRMCTLRLEAAVNGQLSGIRWAKDYELGPP